MNHRNRGAHPAFVFPMAAASSKPTSRWAVAATRANVEAGHSSRIPAGPNGYLCPIAARRSPPKDARRPVSDTRTQNYALSVHKSMNYSGDPLDQRSAFRAGAPRSRPS